MESTLRAIETPRFPEPAQRTGKWEISIDTVLLGSIELGIIEPLSSVRKLRELWKVRTICNDEQCAYELLKNYPIENF